MFKGHTKMAKIENYIIFLFNYITILFGGFFMQTIINIPDNVKGIEQRYLHEGIAALLYYTGKLSEKEACDMIAIDRRKFEEEILPKFGFSVIGGTPQDVSYEVNSTI
jgi:hypothetical protein